MSDSIIIKINKKDNFYDWGGANKDGIQYMWGAAYDDPFEMLDAIKSAIGEDMYQSGWRKLNDPR